MYIHVSTYSFDGMLLFMAYIVRMAINTEQAMPAMKEKKKRRAYRLADGEIQAACHVYIAHRGTKSSEESARSRTNAKNIMKTKFNLESFLILDGCTSYIQRVLREKREIEKKKKKKTEAEPAAAAALVMGD